ncbi:hypothetical protein D0Z07_8980 [Hyphodiscus hymeniophilus]|uniref:Uncharacterized protein n=1 Tax=Hyphodiscus hymeniophilus TaxID=353542 RepID=A0A9P6VDX3_9HELO|nr:hypothetical protein D0Z07_8980 [Hyphodiscus hymeniophilus]
MAINPTSHTTLVSSRDFDTTLLTECCAAYIYATEALKNAGWLPKGETCAAVDTLNAVLKEPVEAGSPFNCKANDS